MTPGSYVLTVVGGFKIGTLSRSNGDPHRLANAVRIALQEQRHLFVKDWLDNALEIRVAGDMSFTQHPIGSGAPPAWMHELQANLVKGTA